MAGTFFGFNTALRGMQAQQRAIYTSAHNIANANQEGYTRQRVVMEATPAYPVPGMNHPGGSGWQIGTGVDIHETRRVRDQFLDSQIRHESASLGLWLQRRDVLQQVEVVFNEPSDTGFNTLLGQFWETWQELAQNAESSPVRTTVLETAKALAEAFNHSADQLETIIRDIDQIIELRVTEINSLARQIVDLNKQIKNIILAGDQPNDLLDRRDLLLDQLARITDFQVEENTVTVDGVQVPDGQIKVILAGSYLVDISSSGENVINQLTTAGGGEVQWENDNTTVAINNGEIKGLQEARAGVEAYLKQLDILARGLAENINRLHREGYDLSGEAVLGKEYENFFVAGSRPPKAEDTSETGITAKNIALNVNLHQDNTKIAAAATSTGEGDGENALKIAQLWDRLYIVDKDNGTLLASDSGVTFEDYYRNFTARLGVEAYEATRMTDNQNTLVQQLSNRKESISGVSLDEEITDMIRYQRAYQAAARMITTLDSMLDKIINGMGASR